MIKKLDIYQDLEAVRAAVHAAAHLFDAQGVISVTSRPEAEVPIHDHNGWLPEGIREGDFSVVNHEFRGTAIEQLLDKLPFGFGRTRLVKMAPKACLSVHWDTCKRYHYAIETNPSCFLVEMNDNVGTFHHIPADGYLYEMDARKTHTALNASKRDRIHLIISDAKDEGLRDGQPSEHAAHYMARA